MAFISGNTLFSTDASSQLSETQVHQPVRSSLPVMTSSTAISSTQKPLLRSLTTLGPALSMLGGKKMHFP